MALILSDLKIPLAAHKAPDDDNKMLCDYAAKRLGVSSSDLHGVRVVRMSLDARKGKDISYVYTLRVNVNNDVERLLCKKQISGVACEPLETEYKLIHGNTKLNNRVIVVGLGPAGLFAAYTLAQEGYKPWVIERGQPIDERTEKVNRYWNGEPLDTECNVMFGEGGAGSFSDGKLTTRIKDNRANRVIELLARYGAPNDVIVSAKPHIGTDVLKKVVKAMREAIVAFGGTVDFSSKLSGLEIKDGALEAVKITANGAERRYECERCVLAVGQGAYDTYDMLLHSGVSMVAKPYSMGIRIEHPREMIDRSQYGAQYIHPRLGAAEYRLTTRAGDRGVYTFCMCPGGFVVASASAPDEVVVNGMSYHARDGENSNSAVVVQVDERDFGNNAKDALRFRKEYERAAFRIGNGAGPCQLAGDYLKRKTSVKLGDVQPTYKPDVFLTDVSKCLPDVVADGIRQGISDFGKKLKGFDMYDSVITAIESRTSSPVRILRESDGQAQGIQGLYPVGEGAGYAGGIVSAAVDGMKAAEQIIALYKEV